MSWWWEFHTRLEFHFLDLFKSKLQNHYCSLNNIDFYFFLTVKLNAWILGINSLMCSNSTPMRILAISVLLQWTLTVTPNKSPCSNSHRWTKHHSAHGTPATQGWVLLAGVMTPAHLHWCSHLQSYTLLMSISLYVTGFSSSLMDT